MIPLSSGKLPRWFFGEDTPSRVNEMFAAQQEPTLPPSDLAVRLAKIIEGSDGSWAFEDDQGHAHSYGLGITVSHHGDVVWQGSRDVHTRGDTCKLFEVARGSADAFCVRKALEARRLRVTRETEEAARAAKEKRLADALEKLERGVCLEDPLVSSAPHQNAESQWQNQRQWASAPTSPALADFINRQIARTGSAGTIAGYY